MAKVSSAPLLDTDPEHNSGGHDHGQEAVVDGAWMQ